MKPARNDWGPKERKPKRWDDLFPKAKPKPKAATWPADKARRDFKVFMGGLTPEEQRLRGLLFYGCHTEEVTLGSNGAIQIVPLDPVSVFREAVKKIEAATGTETQSPRILLGEAAARRYHEWFDPDAPFQEFMAKMGAELAHPIKARRAFSAESAE